MSAGAARRWRVVQGRSAAVVVAPDIEEARRRAAQIGLKNPDSIVLQEQKQ